MSIGLLHTDIEGILVDTRSEGESHHALLHKERPTEDMQLLHMAQRISHHALFGHGSTLLAAVIGEAPLLGQAQAVGHHLRCHRAVLVVGVQTLELVDMVAFGLQLLAAERH